MRQIFSLILVVGLLLAAFGVELPAADEGQTATKEQPTTGKVREGRAVPSAKIKKSLKRTPDVIYVPTPQPVVDKMLEMAQVKEGEVVYDLGCGDGRIVVSAAKKGAKARGFDINPERIRESEVNIRENKVGKLASVEHADIFELDLSGADVITLYLLPTLNVKLIPQLEKLKPGARIVSHDFDMRGVKPEKVVEVEAGGRSHTVYLFKTPLQKDAGE